MGAKEEKWPHAELAVRWYSAPKGSLEWKTRKKNSPYGFGGWTRAICPPFSSEYEYLLRPVCEMEILPEARVPGPLRALPQAGDTYFTICSVTEAGISGHRWTGSPSDIFCFKRRLCFETAEDATAYLAAISARRSDHDLV